jgi:transcriptional regulator GlxA family with amidase domain
VTPEETIAAPLYWHASSYAATRSGRTPAFAPSRHRCEASARSRGARSRARTRPVKWAPPATRSPPALDANAIFVADGPIHTSAGITAGIDLCLALVEADHGAELARDVARHLVVFMQRPGGQAQFSVRLDLATTTKSPLRHVLDDVVRDPTADHSLEALSERAGFSVRNLTRVFQRELGVTPGRYVEWIRVEAAKARLQRSDEPLATIARTSGFGSDETMRRAFWRELSTTPAAYRERFRTTGAKADAEATPTTDR